jgi:hypothetical protein
MSRIYDYTTFNTSTHTDLSVASVKPEAEENTCTASCIFLKLKKKIINYLEKRAIFCKAILYTTSQYHVKSDVISLPPLKFAF